MSEFEIVFTQYMRPNGRPVAISILRPKEIYDKSEEIRAAGFVFECEVLMTGDVSLTITDPDLGDLSMKVVRNGPGVVSDAVDQLIRDFDIEAAKVARDALSK